MNFEEVKRALLLELNNDSRELDKAAQRDRRGDTVLFLAGRAQGLRLALELLGMNTREIQEAVDWQLPVPRAAG